MNHTPSTPHSVYDAKILAIQAMGSSAQYELQIWLFSAGAIILGLLLSSVFNLHLSPLSIEFQADPTALFAETSGTLG